MGAWDITAFGNDDASDFAMDLIESQRPVDVLAGVLGRSKEGDYLEAPEGCQLVAAAAIVAAAISQAPRRLPDNLNSWIAGRESSLRPLAKEAAEAVQRVRGPNSELRELWEESDDYAAWLEDLDFISKALG